MAFHGIVSKREDIGVQPTTLVSQSVVGCVGTAPDADVEKFGDGTNITYNRVFTLTSASDAADLGDDGTLPISLRGIFRQGQATVQVVIVENGVAIAGAAVAALAVSELRTFNTWTLFNNYTTTDTIWAVLSDFNDGNRYLAFKNLTTTDETALGALVPGRTITVEPSGGGTVLHTYTIVEAYDATNSRIRINPGASHRTLTNGTDYDLESPAISATAADEVTRDNMLGDELDSTGVYALLGADPLPKILCVGAIEETIRYNGNANALASGLVDVAEKVRGVAIISGPGTTQDDAKAYADDFDSDVGAAYMVEPWIVTADGTVPGSPSVAGKIAVNDAQQGFWVSPSNMAINGALGLSREISHGYDGSQSDDLNDNYIAALVKDGGIRLWGNETLSPTSPSYRFINVARTANAIQDSLDRGLKWAIDRNITVRLLDQIAQSVNLFLATLTAQGAITGGICYPDGAKNNVATVKEGRVFFNVEWSAVYPLQTLELSLQLSDRFLDAVLAEL